MTAIPAHRRNQHCLPWQVAARVSIPLHSDVIVMGIVCKHTAQWPMLDHRLQRWPNIGSMDRACWVIGGTLHTLHRVNSMNRSNINRISVDPA